MSGRLLYNDVAMEKALRATSGNRTRAAQILGCAVSTVSAYVQRSERLQAVERELVESLVDRAEDIVRDHLDGGNLIASFFVLKTRGRERGWSERVDVSLSVDQGAPGPNLPAAPVDYGTWLSQVAETERVAGRLQAPLELDSVGDAEIVSDSEQLERVTSDETTPRKITDP